MKVFLFLYPIVDYFELSWTHGEGSGEAFARRMDEIIRVRYRNRGYRVAWLLFGEKQNERVPDRSRIMPELAILPSDIVVSAGVSFRRHCSERRYPDLHPIFAALPRKTEAMVLGGFHQDDCVDRVANYVHAKGIPVFVDEDLTDRAAAFWEASGWEVPLERTPQEYAAAYLRYLREDGGCLGFSARFCELAVESNRKERERKPWLVQI